MTRIGLSLVELKDSDITEEKHAKEAGMNAEEYERARRLIGRKPNKAELSIIATLWSERCSYKSSKAYLSALSSQGPHVLTSPRENVGVLDIGDNMALVVCTGAYSNNTFMEAMHNLNSDCARLLRDISYTGAKPLITTNLFCFGESDIEKNKLYFDDFVNKNINYFDVLASRKIYFNKSYNNNYTVNSFALGIVNKRDLFIARASELKNRVLYVCPDPAKEEPAKSEKLLLDACLRARQEDPALAIQDIGIAGLSSVCFKMAHRSSTGIFLRLDDMPLGTIPKSGSEIMLSEKHGRSLLLAEPKKVLAIKEIFAHYGFLCIDIGSVTSDGIVRIFYKGEEIVHLGSTLIIENAPRYRQSFSLPQKKAKARSLKSQWPIDVREALQLYAQEMTSKKSNLLSLLKIPHSKKVLAFSFNEHQRLLRLDAYEGARRLLLQAMLEVASLGAFPVAMSYCLNFGSAENEAAMANIKYAIDGLAEAAKKAQIPVLSGKQNVYNENNAAPILPMLSVAMLGLCEEEEPIAISEVEEGDLLMLLGDLPQDFLGLEQHIPSNCSDVVLMPWDFQHIGQLCSLTKLALHHGFTRSAHVLGQGGLLASLISIMKKSALGLSISFGSEWLLSELGLGLLSEASPRVLLVVKKHYEAHIKELCAQRLAVLNLGVVTKKDLQILHNKSIIAHENLQNWL
jgi:phosphoribosylformylglycinamidine (FGAM) synthase-like enzyme